MAIRGVLLSRRDNSAMVRSFYSDLIMGIFYRKSNDELFDICRDYIYRLFSGSVSSKDLTITKKVGDIFAYKIRTLPPDDKKCIARLKDLDLYDKSVNLVVLRQILADFIERKSIDEYKGSHLLEWEIIQEYVKKIYPGQVQLAERIRERGCRVDVGERLAYVIIKSEKGLKGKVSEKLEGVDYFNENKAYLQIDPLYYMKLCIKPFDELFAILKMDKVFQAYYKCRENYSKVLQQLTSLTMTKIIIIEK